ncbi:MAG: VanZ family protein [Lysinibacillus sp.]
MAKKSILSVNDETKLPLPFRSLIDTYYAPIKFVGWMFLIIYSFVAFYQLVINRLVAMFTTIFFEGNSPSEVGLFDYSGWNFNTNFVPFETIMRYAMGSQYFNMELIILNLLGNLFIFTPIGLLIPFLSKKFRKGLHVILLGFILSLAVETIQFIFTVGSADIDDLILNTAGAWLGYLVYKYMMKISRKKQQIMK